VFKVIQKLEDLARDVFWYYVKNDVDLIDSVCRLYTEDLVFFTIEDLKAAKTAQHNSNVVKEVAVGIRKNLRKYLENVLVKTEHVIKDDIDAFNSEGKVLEKSADIYNEELVKLDSTQIQHLDAVLFKDNSSEYYRSVEAYMVHANRKVRNLKNRIDLFLTTIAYRVDMHILLLENGLAGVKDENTKALILKSMEALKQLELEDVTDVDKESLIEPSDERQENTLTKETYDKFITSLKDTEILKVDNYGKEVVVKLERLSNLFISIIRDGLENPPDDTYMFDFYATSATSEEKYTHTIRGLSSSVRQVGEGVNTILKAIRRVKGK